VSALAAAPEALVDTLEALAAEFIEDHSNWRYPFAAHSSLNAHRFRVTGWLRMELALRDRVFELATCHALDHGARYYLHEQVFNREPSDWEFQLVLCVARDATEYAFRRSPGGRRALRALLYKAAIDWSLKGGARNSASRATTLGPSRAAVYRAMHRARRAGG